MTSVRTELWEPDKATKDVTGHVRFTVDNTSGQETVTLPYPVLVTLLQLVGLRRKLNSDHAVRMTVTRLPEQPPPPLETAPSGDVTGQRLAPPGYRWMTPQECHGNAGFCSSCSPRAPQRRVARIES